MRFCVNLAAQSYAIAPWTIYTQVESAYELVRSLIEAPLTKYLPDTPVSKEGFTIIAVEALEQHLEIDILVLPSFPRASLPPALPFKSGGAPDGKSQ
jgi:hypothetical protein